MIQDVLILGGGTAGFFMAASLKTHHPGLRVQLVRSPGLGIIGVGEGSTPDLLDFIHGHLRIPPAEFYRAVKPSLKLGIKFLWGKHDYNYSFTNALRLRLGQSDMPIGFVCDEAMTDVDPATSLMAQDKVFPRSPEGPWPLVQKTIGYHVENAELVAWLETLAAKLGVEIIDGDMATVEQADGEVRALHLKDGRRLAADFFVDASGFRAELIGKAMGTPFISYADALFCDKALVGGWERGDEPILPYTIAETMDAGWAWQIEHPTRINRGYVYSSKFITDAEAEAEFRRKNPKVGPTRIVPFVSGRYARQWVGNVFAIGNAAGFVEPLEATSLLCIANECRMLTVAFRESGLRNTPIMREHTDRLCGRLWDEIRDFLAVHYRFNQRSDTPFWRHCREHVALNGAQKIVDFYRENGPTFCLEVELLKPAQSIFLLQGFWLKLVAMGVPHGRTDRAGPALREEWARTQAKNRAMAATGLTVAETLRYLHDPRWAWTPGFYKDEA
jgi:tryptophan halogenase